MDKEKLITKSRAGRKRTNLREVTKTSQLGTQEGWTRATFIVREDCLEKLKSLAFWERRNIKDVMDDVFSSYLKASIQPGRRKVTYVIASDLVRRLKVLGAETDRELSDLVSEAIEDLIKRKTIKPMPKGEHEAL